MAKHDGSTGSTSRLIPSAVLLAAALAGCGPTHQAGPELVDRAKAAGKTAADFPQAADDYFREMDGGIALTPDEARGRNTWMLWTAGNEAFWDYMANHSVCAFDLLKVLDSRGRSRRFHVYGLMHD